MVNSNLQAAKGGKPGRVRAGLWRARGARATLAAMLLCASLPLGAGAAADPGEPPDAAETEIIDDFAPDRRLSAPTLARQCPTADYDRDDAGAAACFYYIRALVDAIIVRRVAGISPACHQILSSNPSEAVDRIRKALLADAKIDRPAVTVILKIIKKRICGR